MPFLYLFRISPAILLGFFVPAILMAEQSQTTVPKKPDLFYLQEYDSLIAVDGWVMSEKLDGVRAYWDGQQLYFRSGRKIQAPLWFIKDFPPFALDGELWLGRQKFSEVSSIVNRQQPDNRWEQVGYHVFEVPEVEGGLRQRLSKLTAYLTKKPIIHLNIIPQHTVRNRQHLQNFLTNIVENGGEGVVVREPEEPYFTGRSDLAFKVKLKQDAECRIVGYTPGKGRLTGMVGALQCRLEEGVPLDLSPMISSVINIGTGLSDAQRQSPPKVGEVITFQYIGLTKNGWPRFPSFLRIRPKE